MTEAETTEEEEGEPAPGPEARRARMLSQGFRVLVGLGFVASALLVALGTYWLTALDYVSTISTASLCALCLLMEMRLERDGAGVPQSIVLSLLYANAFAQSFEILYHFTFPEYLNYFAFPFLNGEGVRYLLTEGVSLLPLVLVRRQLRLGRLTWLLAGCFVLSWGAWVAYGFPQYFTTSTYYAVLLPLPVNSYSLSLLLNFGSKALLALLFASAIRPLKLIDA